MTFFMEPRGSRQPFLLAPWPVLFLIGLLATAYAAFSLAPVPLQGRLLADFAFFPARYSHAFVVAHHYDPGSAAARALPFIGYIFLHGSLSHLAINCVWLLPFGSVVARRFGAVTFFAFFLLCGVAGAAVHLALNWGSTIPVIGASAAISGLMAAAFRMMHGYQGLPDGAAGDGRRLAPLLSPRIVIWSAVWAGVNVLAGLTGLGAGAEVHLVAWQAHLGGYFAGLVLAGPFAAFTAGVLNGAAQTIDKGHAAAPAADGGDAMTDDQPAQDQPASGQAANGGNQAVPPPAAPPRPPFPAIRLLYAIGFAVVAWFVFWITLILALAQFVVVAINGQPNDELKTFSQNLIQYLWELLAFVCFVRDEQPFPIGAFPKRS